jgi:enterochelin esterase family protein
MSGSETDFFALKNVPHGRIEKAYYHSNSLNMERRLHVYLPPNFQNIKGKLPVLYLLHGGGDNDISWTGAAKANFILDNLYAQGKLKNMIVVMPAGHIPGRGLSMGTGPDQDAFCKDLLNDIIPFIEKTYPASSKKDDRAIAGFSMGGIQTLNAALWNPEKFGYVFPMGTGYFPASIKEVDEKYSEVMKKVAANPFKLLYIGKGKDDNLVAVNNKAMMEMFDKYGIKYKYQEMPGGHSFVFTRRYLAFFAPLLFR